MNLDLEFASLMNDVRRKFCPIDPLGRSIDFFLDELKGDVGLLKEGNIPPLQVHWYIINYKKRFSTWLMSFSNSPYPHWNIMQCYIRFRNARRAAIRHLLNKDVGEDDV